MKSRKSVANRKPVIIFLGVTLNFNPQKISLWQKKFQQQK
jgi:hypothetical protein